MPAAMRILAVDRNLRNLEILGQLLGAEGYEIVPADSVAAFDALLAGAQFDAALIDIAGLDATVWLRCQLLRERGVPFLLLSTRADAALRRAATEHGAEHVLQKPLALRELVAWLRLLAEA